jgi:hypothetical protein
MSRAPAGRIGVLPHRRKNAIYLTAAGVWITGILWLIFHYFITVPDQFGFTQRHPLQKWWMIAHALLAVFAVWFFGMLWPNHVKRAWTKKVRRGTGGTLFGVTAWLSLTGVALYYIGDDSWRSATSLAHWIIGVVALGVFLLHLLTRRSHDQE